MECYGCSTCQPKTYVREDPWRRDKYQVELEAEFPGDLEEMSGTLEKEGFYIVDLDQWGKLFFSRHYPSLEADLKEVEEYGSQLRLSLKRGDLQPEAVVDAQKELLTQGKRILYR